MRLALAAALSIPAAAATAAAPVVVTDTPVVHSLVSQVMDGVGEPTVLLEPGADPHSFQLRPSQAAALSDAALIFWVGGELTPWLDRALGTLSGAAIPVELIEAEGLSLLDFGETGAHGHDDHADEHDHDHDDAHDHEGVDPHVWLDPANAKVWVGVIAEELSAADPANATTYAANAEAAERRIDDATTAASATLAPVQDRPIVTFHDAYGYFARAFDVEIAGSVALGDAAAPGARRLRELQDSVGADGIACVFREPQHDASIAEAIAADAAIGLGTLDPSGSSLTYGPALYGDLITGLAASIAECVTASG